ncbi:alpha-E domain-containing protein [Paenibacillus protaetiae]|uniref:Alpha-E domain-containing protein n=1 Tax=Paenibacillus protaetiae TaxID=2509456 RepID=A0A4P6F0F1_9BACL|nr:alpha-E domain-containing protein [Paenibacillus protaetiae]QAY66467.1 alpha-E domain-containing protein [Paenibacillus protaetiae]
MTRYAEQLYWIGRYLERADHYVRMINVYYHRRDDRATHHEWLRLAAAAGDLTGLQNAHPHPNELNTLSYFTFEPSNPNSILSSVQKARNNTRVMRQMLPGELWELINSLYIWLKEQDVYQVQAYPPYKFYKRIGEWLSLFNGAADSSMSRGRNWNFIQAGKYLERMRNTIHVLYDSCSHVLADESCSSDYEYSQCVSLLKACGGYEAFRKLYANHVNLAETADFLLQNAYFPRSVRFAVHALKTCCESDLLIHGQIEQLSDQINHLLVHIRIDGISRDANDGNAILDHLLQMTESCDQLGQLISDTCMDEENPIRIASFVQ